MYKYSGTLPYTRVLAEQKRRGVMLMVTGGLGGISQDKLTKKKGVHGDRGVWGAFPKTRQIDKKRRGFMVTGGSGGHFLRQIESASM